MAQWKTFFFESNRFFDHIHNMDDWARLRAAYPDKSNEELLAAREATYGGTRPEATRQARPNFGFRFEHDGQKTLRDFLAEHGMLDIIAPTVDAPEQQHE